MTSLAERVRDCIKRLHVASLIAYQHDPAQAARLRMRANALRAHLSLIRARAIYRRALS
jgi:hypothetical protein